MGSEMKNENTEWFLLIVAVWLVDDEKKKSFYSTVLSP